MELEKKIHTLFIANKLSLSFAESCTGGALTFSLVQFPDCSLYMLGSVVAYSNAAKINLLGVQKSTLEKWGAVSEKTAKEMVQGSLKQFESDYAVATTGIAGPKGETAQKPIGTVCFAIASKRSKLISWTSYFKGERAKIIEAAVTDVLQHLYEFITI